MKKLCLLLIFTVSVFTYAIEGTWGTIRGNNDQTQLTFIDQKASNNGTVTVHLVLSSCPGVAYSLNIYESYLQVIVSSASGAARSQCKVTTGQITSILDLLDQKILYFQIVYDQLTLYSVVSKDYLPLRRIKNSLENSALYNNFYAKGVQNSPLLLSSGNTFILCGGQLLAEFESNQIDSILVNPASVIDTGCKDGGKSASFLRKLQESRYYRKTQNGSIILYDARYLKVLQLIPASIPRVPPSIDLKVPLIDIHTAVDSNAWQVLNTNPVLNNINSINQMDNIDVQANIFNNTDIRLIGSYHPHSINGRAVNSNISQIVRYIFSLNSLFVIGTCLNYNYDYSVINGTYIDFIPNKLRQVKTLLPTPQQCDLNNDRIFLQPIQDAETYQLTATKIGFMNHNDTISLLLQRIEGVTPPVV